MTEEKRECCPRCGSIRVCSKISADTRKPYYKCNKCGWTGDTVNKIIWNFSIPSRGMSPPVGRTKVTGIRERHCCPDCNSVRLRKRIYTQDYYCENCKWIGKNPKKVKWGAMLC